MQTVASDCILFAHMLRYGLSKSKNRDKIITKCWKTITKSRRKIEKVDAMFCRSALLLSVFENRFCLSQFVKKLSSTERGTFVRHFCISKVITIVYAAKSGDNFHIFQRAFKQNKLRSYHQRWQTFSQGVLPSDRDNSVAVASYALLLLL